MLTVLISILIAIYLFVGLAACFGAPGLGGSLDSNSVLDAIAFGVFWPAFLFYKAGQVLYWIFVVCCGTFFGWLIGHIAGSLGAPLLVQFVIAVITGYVIGTIGVKIDEGSF